MIRSLFLLAMFAFAQIGSAQDATIEGRVVVGGRPVASALVAAIPHGPREWWTVAAVARTVRDGSFRFAGLVPGRHSLTATSDRYAAGHVETAGTGQSDVVISMERSGRRLTGRARHAGGTPLRGRIHAARLGPLDGDLFVAQTDEEGRFSVMLPAARYRLFAEAADGMVETAVDLEDDDAEVDLEIERVYRVTPPGALEWIRGSAIPLKTVKAGSGFDDLLPLRSVIGPARIVALGEATHGTREFFQLKHRMFEFLVAEMGFTVFAIEASAPEAAAVNEFVLDGKGDAEDVVARMDFWAWNTAEVVDMVRWMRAWNADARHTAKVRFHGFDMQNPDASVEILRAYLERVDPVYATAFDPHERGALDALERRFRDRRNSYAAASSQVEWSWARRQIDLIRQGRELLRVRARAFEVRDRRMAANVKWILDHEPAGTRMVVWAHNGHVAAEAPRFSPGGSMGEHLRRTYGDAIRTIGLAFDRGSFRAEDARGRLRAYDALAAKPASLDGALAAAGPPLFALDLRTATGIARRWIESPLEHRSIGLAYDPETPGNDWVTIHPIRSYDAVIFVAQTTPTGSEGYDDESTRTDRP
jgi:erythromycin esterase